MYHYWTNDFSATRLFVSTARRTKNSKKLVSWYKDKLFIKGFICRLYQAKAHKQFQDQLGQKSPINFLTWPQAQRSFLLARFVGTSFKSWKRSNLSCISTRAILLYSLILTFLSLSLFTEEGARYVIVDQLQFHCWFRLLFSLVWVFEYSSWFLATKFLV